MEETAPTGRELEILKVLWELGPTNVRQVRERLCPNGELAFTTVQTLLRIMDEKGLVTHKSAGDPSSMPPGTVEKRRLPASSSRSSTGPSIRSS